MDIADYSLILVGGPEDLSETLLEDLDRLVDGRGVVFAGVRMPSDMRIADLLANLSEHASVKKTDIVFTKKYFPNITNQLLSVKETNVSVYIEQDGVFELWGYYQK